MKFSIDSEKCALCSRCYIECPVQAVELETDEYMINEEKCISCAICYDVCAFSAILQRS